MIDSFLQESKRLYQSCKDFGLCKGVKFMYYKIQYVYFHKGMDKLIDFEYKYLRDFLSNKISEYNKQSFCNDETESKNVWVCWWQGEDSMPEWCKMCFNNLKRNIPADYTLNLITKDNVKDFVDIPKHVYDRLESGNLTITQFSDILREALLYFQGGLWVDASVWTLPNFFNTIDTSKEFYSVKLGYVHRPEMIGQKISECMWSGFFMYGKKGCLVTKFAFDCMCAYYKNHISTIDYFIQNIIIRIGYDNVPQIKALIDAYPINNVNLYALPDQVYANALFDQTKWEQLTQSTSVFKITQKRKYLTQVDGTKTFYGHLKDIYNDTVI